MSFLRGEAVRVHGFEGFDGFEGFEGFVGFVGFDGFEVLGFAVESGF